MSIVIAHCMHELCTQEVHSILLNSVGIPLLKNNTGRAQSVEYPPIKIFTMDVSSIDTRRSV